MADVLWPIIMLLVTHARGSCGQVDHGEEFVEEGTYRCVSLMLSITINFWGMGKSSQVVQFQMFESSACCRLAVGEISY
jgi:hypothetical protein